MRKDKPEIGDLLTGTQYAFHSGLARSTVQGRAHSKNPDIRIPTQIVNDCGVPRVMYEWMGPKSMKDYVPEHNPPVKGKKQKTFSYLDEDIAFWIERKCKKKVNGKKQSRSTVINTLLATVKKQEEEIAATSEKGLDEK